MRDREGGTSKGEISVSITCFRYIFKLLGNTIHRLFLPPAGVLVLMFHRGILTDVHSSQEVRDCNCLIVARNTAGQDAMRSFSKCVRELVLNVKIGITLSLSLSLSLFALSMSVIMQFKLYPPKRNLRLFFYFFLAI